MFVVDTVSRSRTFGDSQVTVSGRSLAVAAGSPYEADQNWVNDGDSTGAQLAALANLYTGLGVSWEVDDWLVPDRVFSHSGTPLSVVLRVAEAIGAIVQADRTALSVRVMPRYPLMPNEWATVSPDVEVAFDAVLSENFERADRPEYTGVYVSGQQQGAVGFVRLAGTSGSNLHPLVTDLLLTEEPALRQRGQAILGASGGQARVTLGLPLLTGAGEPGALSVGQLVRVLDPDGTWHGMVRSVSVSASLPTVTQTVVLERHTKEIEGSVSDGTAATDPIVFTGPIEDQELTEGEAFSLDISGYWTGGIEPYTWSMRSGTLPAGLTLNASTGVLSGTPTVDGAYSVAFRATDAEFGMADSNTLEVTVAAAGGVPLFLETFSGTGSIDSVAVEVAPSGATWAENYSASGGMSGGEYVSVGLQELYVDDGSWSVGPSVGVVEARLTPTADFFQMYLRDNNLDSFNTGAYVRNWDIEFNGSTLKAWVRLDGGSYVEIINESAPALDYTNGNVWRFEVEPTAQRLYLDGSLIASAAFDYAGAGNRVTYISVLFEGALDYVYLGGDPGFTYAP